MEKKKKLIILGIIALTLVIIGTTYAILTWTSTKINLGLNSGCFTIDYTKGQDISGNLKLLNESDLISNNKLTIKNGIGISAVNIGINSSCTIEGYGSIYLNVTNISEAFTTGDSKGALKYAVLSNTSTITTPSSVTVDSLLNQSFDIVSTGSITSNDTITLLTKQLSNTEIYKYLVVIYVDNALAGNSITSASFTGNISADANQGKYIEQPPDYCFKLGNKDETNKTASITRYLCAEGNTYGYETVTDLRIPSVIDGYTINAIGAYAFFSNKLTSIIIPNTITSIGNSAFGYNATLENISVNPNNAVYDSRDNCNAIIETSSNKLILGSRNTIIPNTVTTIGKEAFYTINITDITIPNSVTTIETRAFSASKLTSLSIPSSVITIEEDAFMSNPLENITVDPDNSVYDSRDNCNAIIETSSNKLILGSRNTVIPNTVITIGKDAFFKNGRANITIPNSVATIETNAFYGNEITNIVIPSSVTSLGSTPFFHNPIESISIDSNNTVYDSRDNCNAIIETSTNTLLQGSKNAIIPNTITALGNYSFDSLGITNITIPDSVTMIAHDAFYFNKLTSITIPDSVTAIGDSAFFGNKLTSIIIPNTVTYIGSSSFAFNNLSYVLIEENSSLSTLKNAAFSSSNSTSTSDGIVYVNNPNLKKIYYNGTTPLPWIYAVSSNYAERNNKFVTGTVPVYTMNSITYNEVVITTGK